MKNFLKYNLPSILWAAFILFLCLLPKKELPSGSFWEADKLGHFAVYVVLAVLVFYGWKKQNTFPFFHRQVLIKILLITFAYGFAVEILQELLTADRHFDVYDAIANGSGAVAGSFAAGKIFGS